MGSGAVTGGIGDGVTGGGGEPRDRGVSGVAEHVAERRFGYRIGLMTLACCRVLAASSSLSRYLCIFWNVFRSEGFIEVTSILASSWGLLADAIALSMRIIRVSTMSFTSERRYDFLCIHR
jgi:hypothetical protein